jgi:hypothetical protein
MVISSRRSLLPRPAVKTVSPFALTFICGFILAAWLLPILLGHPVTLNVFLFLFFSIIVGIGHAVSSLLNKRRLQRMIKERKNDSICRFARSFDYRRIDTRIIRAVYEEACDWTSFPTRISDDFDKDFHMDPEDLEDMAQIIAHRAQRSLDDYKKNPFYGQVNTVKGLVLFFLHQPLRV